MKIMPDGTVRWTPREAAELDVLRSLPRDQELRELCRWLLGSRVRRRKLAGAALAAQGELVASELVGMLEFAANNPVVQLRILEVLARMNLRPTRTMARALEAARDAEDPEVRRQAAAVTAKIWPASVINVSTVGWDPPKGLPTLPGGQPGYSGDTSLADLLKPAAS